MKKINRDYQFWGIVTIGICVISVFLLVCFTSYKKVGTYTEAGSLGSAIGGITAPIVGCLTIILLVSTLIHQMKSNKEQSDKNEIDFLFSLISQLENDLNNFYRLTLINEGKSDEVRRIDYGHAGLVEYWRFIRDVKLSDSRISLPSHWKFSNDQEVDKIMLMIDSFELVKERIEISNVKIKKIMYRKLNSFFKAYLEYPLSYLSARVDFRETYKDRNSLILKSFLERYSNNMLLNIDE